MDILYITAQEKSIEAHLTKTDRGKHNKDRENVCIFLFSGLYENGSLADTAIAFTGNRLQIRSRIFCRLMKRQEEVHL